jgi:hypothetical protein
VRTRELRELCRRDRDWLLEEFVRRYGAEGPGPLLPAAVLDDILTEVLEYELVEAELPRGQMALCDFDRRRVTVTTRLADCVRPNTDLVALANSTKAHELGHIRLHEADLARTDRTTPDLFGEAPVRVLVTFRDELRKGRLSRQELRREWEADLYASVFLVPERLLEEQKGMLRLRRAVERQEELTSRYLWRLTYELARTFGVSGTLMKNRLVDLGVLGYCDGELRVTRQAVLGLEV